MAIDKEPKKPEEKEQTKCVMAFSLIARSSFNKDDKRQLYELKNAMLLNTLNLLKKVLTPFKELITFEIAPISIKTSDLRETLTMPVINIMGKN